MRYVLPLSPLFHNTPRCFKPPDVIGIVSKVSVVAVISINAQKTVSPPQLFSWVVRG